MNRIRLLKFIYLIIILLGISGVIYLQIQYELPYYLVILIAFLFFIPGRIAAYFYRDFFKGLKFLHSNQIALSEKHFQIFLATLKKRPWIKKIVWFLWGFYTQDIEVMTYNNLGIIYLKKSEFDNARNSFYKALQQDEKYLKPYYNLAIMEYVLGNKKESKIYYNKMKNLYPGKTPYDQIIQKAQEILLFSDVQSGKNLEGPFDTAQDFIDSLQK